MMPGIQMEEVRDAMLAAYNKNSLTQMMRFRMDKDLLDLVADGPLQDMTFDLLSAAEEEGWDARLVREAYRFRPENEKMLRVYEKYGLAPVVDLQKGGEALSVGGAARLSSAGLQKTIRDENPMLDLGVLRQRLTQLEVRVCRIDRNESPLGTGFLVGGEVVLTNYHVMESVVKQTHAETAFSVLFDYKKLNNGQTTPGVRIGLHPAGGLLASSPYTDGEKTNHPDATLPTEDELDFALLRLARPAGSEPNGAAEAPPRGWEVLPTGAPALEADQGILIAQHPRGEPMKLAIDTQAVVAVNGNGTRVRYRTNTEGGSSGSPVFDMLCRLVALHHYGDPALNHPAGYNQGILPLHVVRNKIVSSGAGDYLGPVE